MYSNNNTVLFLNRRTAEELPPIDHAAMISITDSSEDDANISEDWYRLYRFHFIDGAYNEDTLRFVGTNYKYIYSSYFDRELAFKLRNTIQQIISDGIQTIVIHCHAGRSRSAAVAKFIHDQHGYLPYNTPDILQAPPASRPKPDLDTLSGMNEMIYTLLNNPHHFDLVLQGIDSSAPPETSEPSLWRRLLAIVSR
ncbi:MAG: hypothetical protein AB2669_17665 [Candidatus Thiodiazotropha endolucinida]|nr:hypothetical protein [Candidatus Thiodiazotropha taylori]MCW4250998.1 hypothetical protein [Candidatus Thiodiazotropha endolucinida]MCG8040112.1 hypothetical protein [Candidatus Thiodiazotropha taylori]MCG8104568.1 hypothetical protein [Candidatus Thiodiazotropha taylori]MCG8121844.1 hypothetical protein [Candidatus Thiodiazotropha taylori]